MNTEENFRDIDRPEAATYSPGAEADSTKPMTTVEAYEKLKSLYPKRKVLVWDWFNESGHRNMHLDVDTHTSQGESWEECFASLNPPSVGDLAKEKKTAAAKLLAEAEALESGEAVAS